MLTRASSGLVTSLIRKILALSSFAMVKYEYPLGKSNESDTDNGWSLMSDIIHSSKRQMYAR